MTASPSDDGRAGPGPGLGLGLGLAAAIASTACRPPAAPTAMAVPPVGTSIAIYQEGTTSLALVDERRWIEVTGGALVLDGIDPAASLASLVIEPLAGAPLVAEACAREQVAWASPAPAPAATPVRCRVTGDRGRRLVRVYYVAPSLRYETTHEVELTAAARATLASRFTIVTAARGGTADVTLFAGLPGGATPPRTITRGSIALDGSTAILADHARDVGARVIRVFTGGRDFSEELDDDDARLDAAPTAIWAWLELDAGALAPGTFYVHVAAPGEAERHVEVGAGRRRVVAGATRIPLWIDDDLHGIRTRTVGSLDDGVVDRFVISVSNSGAVARDVWIEEPLRPAKRRTVRTRGDVKPAIVGDVARAQLHVGADDLVRARFAIAYGGL